MAASIEYKDERSGDLRLHLFRGPLDLEAFQVLERRRMRLGGFDIDASIIGASHAVQVRVGAETVTEALACRTAAVDLFADRLIGVWGVDDAVRRQAAPDVGYEFACEVAPLELAEPRLKELRQAAAGAQAQGAIGLRFRFPRRTERTPETLLRVWVEEGAMRIRSMHVYPGEDVAVTSDTVIRDTRLAGAAVEARRRERALELEEVAL